MKKFTAVIILATFLSLSLCGCTGETGSPQSGAAFPSGNVSDNSPTESSDSAPVSSEDSASSPAEVTPTEPAGEPTFLIGLDGKAILTSEITKLENTDKTAETLTEDDLWAEVYCDGFAYYKEPSGVGYDNYNNPELFDGWNFIGEVPENTNEWKRVNVGDEICGLKVKSAAANFMVNDWDEWKFPARYYSMENPGFLELEGSIEVEGFFQVNNRIAQYPDMSELMWFYPTNINLPLTPSYSVDEEKGFETPFECHVVFNHIDEFFFAGEFGDIALGYFSDAECDMDGIGVGDIAYARITLGNIRCSGVSIQAELENIERLSDILAHDEDDYTTGYQMGI